MLPVCDKSEGEYDGKEYLREAIYAPDVCHLLGCERKAVVYYGTAKKEHRGHKADCLNNQPNTVLPLCGDISVKHFHTQS